MKKMLLFAALLAFTGTAVAQDPIKDRLEKSPRHHEWVSVKNGDRTTDCFLVFPEVKDKATAVLVIHENKGLTDWVRGVADQLAEAGYIAIAPDMLTGLAPKGGRTKDFDSVDKASQALYQLKNDQVVAGLSATADYVVKLPACNGKLAVAGFCWGGGKSFQFATLRPDLKAAFVFYGPPPTADEMKKIACPVYGFYGGNDARINASIPKSDSLFSHLPL